MALARLGPVKSKGEMRARSHRAMLAAGRRDNPELSDYARARLDPFYGVAIVPDDPYAPDGDVRDAWDDSPPADCPYRIGKRSPRRCTRPSGHDGGHDPAPAAVAPIPAPLTPDGFEAVGGSPLVAQLMREQGLSTDPSTGHFVPTTRPTCERCGQSFRLAGNGAEWHRVNRPDCAAVPRQLAAVS